MKFILSFFFVISAFSASSQDCLYSDEVDKFSGNRVQTSNGSIIKYKGVIYNLYFTKTTIDTSEYFDLRFVMNAYGSNSLLVGEGDKLQIIFAGGSKLELKSSKIVKTNFVGGRSIVNVPYSISKEDLFRLSQLTITDIRFHTNDSYSDIVVKKYKVQSKIIEAATCILG
ncbi:MAG: hypothetical protein ACPG21_12235 [Crocinitomicaceae bacterium]